MGLRTRAAKARTDEYVANLLAAAQVHATLALVEQQRIANLIAFLDHAEGDQYGHLHADIDRYLHDSHI